MWWGGALLVGMALVFLFREPLLRSVASMLIVQNPLEHAAAIVCLAGQTPFREMEAAKLYRAGWAPVVVVARELRREEWDALLKLGIALTESWELRREVLIREGVPSSAILVPEGEAEGTFEELKIVAWALHITTQPVILVTSKYHTRRTRLIWNHVTGGRSRAIMRLAESDPFDPARWWRQRRFILSVVREYLGLVNYWLGFPVGTSADSR